MHRIFAALLLLLAAPPAAAQSAPVPTPAPTGRPLSWTDIADLTLASPAIVRVTVRRTTPLSRREAPDVPPGEVRVLVEGDLVAALKAPGLVPGQARWLWQGPAGPRGRPPFGRGAELLLFAAPVPEAATPGSYRLVNAAGQQPWSDALDTRVRQLIAEARRPDAPAAIAAITNGFHVQGTIAGESESQFFLETADGRPMVLVVLRRPGARPSVAIATGDLIDESAAPIVRETLLWRALACTLPDRLPDRLSGDQGLVADFAELRRQIGACGRTL